jgi:hypothetical protein
MTVMKVMSNGAGNHAGECGAMSFRARSDAASIDTTRRAVGPDAGCERWADASSSLNTSRPATGSPV